MSNKMLIDASHPEETRVVVLRGNRVEEFDFESASKKQLRGNIYLAKVTRVEPSLQAAFVEYGGNRHGFLAFSEIHPDYYQIPVADRQALLEEEARSHREDEDEPSGERRSRRHRDRAERSARAPTTTSTVRAPRRRRQRPASRSAAARRDRRRDATKARSTPKRRADAGRRQRARTSAAEAARRRRRWMSFASVDSDEPVEEMAPRRAGRRRCDDGYSADEDGRRSRSRLEAARDDG